MYYRLFHLFYLLTFCIICSFEWDFLLNLDEKDKLVCYSCKGNECQQVTNNYENKIICNKNTQLCWAGFVDQQPYRTCASRYCTPSDFSLDSDVRIETCCRSNLCNSISLTWPKFGKTYKRNSSSRRIKKTTTTTTQATKITATIKINTTTTIDYFIGAIVDDRPAVSISKDSYSDDEEVDSARLQTSPFDAKDSHSVDPKWKDTSYDNDYSNGVASISSILLFIIPLLLVLLF